VPALVAGGQAVVGGTGDRVGVKCAGEVRRLDDNPGLGIKLDLDLDLVTERDAGGLPIGLAEAEQEPAAHNGDPAPPRVPVDRDDHRRPLASTERLHDLWRLLQSSHRLRRLDLGSKLHALLLPILSARYTRQHSSSASRCSRKRLSASGWTGSSARSKPALLDDRRA